jgi:carbon monoxide dehydrogenase subunit G
MQLEHTFTVPVSIDDAWNVLLDIELIAPCMPGAAIDSVDGDAFTGTVKVKLGPVGMTYKGSAQFAEKDAEKYRVVIEAKGRDARGNGTANAVITATLTPSADSTAVKVITDLDITGKPAQFGRGVLVEVGNTLIGQFADCLASKLAATPQPADEPIAEVEPIGVAELKPTTRASTAGPSGAALQAAPEPINLIQSAGPAIAKRLAPLALVLIMVTFFLARRRRAAAR